MSNRRIDLSHFDGPADNDDDEQKKSARAITTADAAEYVRSAYISCRRRFSGQPDYGSGTLPWDGEGRDAWGRRRQSVWRPLAEHIIGLGADPLTYITAQFWLAPRSNNQAPSPNTFSSAAAVDRYRAYAQEICGTLQQQLARELASVRVMAHALQKALNWAPTAAMRQAICDVGQVEASPLIRHCLAVEYNMPEVARRFKSRALLQYVFQRQQYDEAWAGCIPPELSAEADELLTVIGLTSKARKKSK